MLRYLHRCSHDRGACFLLALTALAFEIVAVYFQYIMLLKPCVLCIYERCALFGVMGAGIIGAIAPKTLLRWVAILIWLYSAWKGVHLAWEHTMIQLHPSPFVTCDFSVRFPSWLPLDKWLPSVFIASGDCTEKSMLLLTFGISQWLMGIFAAYLLIALLVLIAQAFKPKNSNPLVS